MPVRTRTHARTHARARVIVRVARLSRVSRRRRGGGANISDDIFTFAPSGIFGGARSRRSETTNVLIHQLSFAEQDRGIDLAVGTS